MSSSTDSPSIDRLISILDRFVYEANYSLVQSPAAADQLLNRIPADGIARWTWGLCDWMRIAACLSDADLLDDQALRTIGLGSFQDGRYVLPLRDFLGRNVGVVTRDREMRPAAVKWLYPPDSVIFNRGFHIFGLSELVRLAPSRVTDRVVVVEGPFDAISLSQHEKAVGVHGSSITYEQCLLLRSLGVPIYLCPDADEKGQGKRNFLKSFEKHAKALAETWIVELPEGHDPDSFVRENGATQFRSLLEDATRLQ